MLPVCNHSAAFMFPQAKQCGHCIDNLSNGIDHALPDTRQISQVEDVVELGRRG